MKKIIISLMLLLVTSTAYAGFGGGRSGGFSSGRSFGGSRSSSISYSRPSYSAPSRTVTISRPAPTVVQHHYTSGSSSNGLVTGMILGNMLSNHNNVQPIVQPVMQAPAPITDNSYQQPTTPYVQQPSNSTSGWSWFWAIMFLGLLGIVVAFIIHVKRDEV